MKYFQRGTKAYMPVRQDTASILTNMVVPFPRMLRCPGILRCNLKDTLRCFDFLAYRVVTSRLCCHCVHRSTSRCITVVTYCRHFCIIAMVYDWC